MGRYEDFNRVTLSALEWTFEHLGLEADDGGARALLDEYRRLAMFPEVPRRAGAPRRRSARSRSSPTAIPTC